jgi:hypothetical protein
MFMGWFVSFAVEGWPRPVDADEIASNTGWAEFGEWAYNLDDEYPELGYLGEHGECYPEEALDALEDDLVRALRLRPDGPSPNVLGVCARLLAVMLGRPERAVGMVVTDGTDGDAPEAQDHDDGGDADEFAEGDWTAYQGPHGGKGWRNTRSGKVVYGDRPGKGGTHQRTQKAGYGGAKGGDQGHGAAGKEQAHPAAQPGYRQKGMGDIASGRQLSGQHYGSLQKSTLQNVREDFGHAVNHVTGKIKKFLDQNVIGRALKAIGMHVGAAGAGLGSALAGVAVEVGKMLGKETWDALPGPVRAGLAVTAVLGQHLEHGLEGIVTGSQKLVEKHARAVGLDEQAAKQMKLIATITDTVGRWTTNIPAAHGAIEQLAEALDIPEESRGSIGSVAGMNIDASFMLAKIGYYIPVGSMTALAAMGLAHPLQTAKTVAPHLKAAAAAPLKMIAAAWRFFAGKKAEGAAGAHGAGEGHAHEAEHGHGHESLGAHVGRVVREQMARKSSLRGMFGGKKRKGLNFQMHDEPEFVFFDEAPEDVQRQKEHLARQLAWAFKRYGQTGDARKDQWWLCVLSAAVDHYHDLSQALPHALEVIEEHPEPLEAPASEAGDWLPESMKQLAA